MTNDLVAAEVLNQTSDAILITDANLTSPGPLIQYVNPAFERLSGYSSQELIGNSPRVLQGPLTSRSVLDELRTKLSAGQHFSGTCINYRKNGESFNIEWHASPIFAADGTITQYMSVHRDVSDRAKFEHQIGQHVQQLVEENQRSSARRAELEYANSHLHALATTDGLTGLSNHRHFHQELARLRQANDVVSLLMLDVDHFKSFNDEFGHPAGDAVLLALADVLRKCVREKDLVARYGGEEFAILLPGQDADHALAVAERVRSAVAKLPTIQREVTVSVGVATARLADGEDNKFVDDADVALYAAKAAGRNRIKHSRHLTRQPAIVADRVEPCADVCAPTANGCAKCQTVGPSKAVVGGSLLLGPQDSDVELTLRNSLRDGGFNVAKIGPLLAVSEVRNRLSEIGTLLKEKLSPYTRSCVLAAYVPAGVATADQAMSALMFARPLTELIDHMEYEWVRDALAEGWLFSVFHPIIHAATGQVFAQEALLRAKNPTTGQILGAGQIIKACDELQLQHQLDQRARQAAIRGAAQYVTGDTRVFINFLPNTIYDPEVCLRTTMEAAATFNVPMSRMVFEVVETEKIPDMDHLHRILDYYRDRGMGTAIDDMGAGFTGVDYITSLRPNYVKLDREFVLTAEATEVGRQQMQAMISAAHDHNAKVIAEGIETEAQMDLCRRHGVDFLQGFLFAKPASPPATVKWPGGVKAAA